MELERVIIEYVKPDFKKEFDNVIKHISWGIPAVESKSRIYRDGVVYPYYIYGVKNKLTVAKMVYFANTEAIIYNLI